MKGFGGASVIHPSTRYSVPASPSPLEGGFLFCQQPRCEVVVGIKGDEDTPRPYCSKHNTAWKRAGLREPYAE